MWRSEVGGTVKLWKSIWSESGGCGEVCWGEGEMRGEVWGCGERC